jgi:hypothetical protein
MVISRLLVVLSAVLLAQCEPQPAQQRAEEAFVARTSVQIRSELAPNAPVVATLDLGERVEIVDRRRRFVRVRTTKGVEGWTRDTRLATPQLLDFMEQLQKQTAADPSQGFFLALFPLNVHLEPYRWSPTIYQLQEDEGADLLRRQLVDRLPSKPQPDRPTPAPTGIDDWCLLRLSNGQAGWVLCSGIYSGIPDEVKQYAERRRITSYFTVGEERAGDIVKPTWLWTQTEDAKLPHDFDVFRVFKWSGRANSYQTIKIERGVQGYLPVTVHPEVESPRGKGPGFSIILDRKGERVLETYVVLSFGTYRVDQKPAPPPRPSIRLEEKVAPPEPIPSLVDRIRQWWSPPSA